MTKREIIAARSDAALKEVAEILARHDPEVGARISEVNHGDSRIPSPTKEPLESTAFLSECLVSLARIVDEQNKPKRRGRPSKKSA